MRPTVSLITTCKGRLQHLKQSLPRFLEVGADEVVVVDYDCPDRCSEFVRANFPAVKIVEHKARPFFNPSEARNSGAAVATGGYLFFADADLLVESDFLGHLRRDRPSWEKLILFTSTADKFANAQLMGDCLILASFFREIGGYDAAMQEYGYEDTDLYRRAEAVAAVHRLDVTGRMTNIRHSNAERTRFRGTANRTYSMALHEAYSDFKMRTNGRSRKWSDLRFRRYVLEFLDQNLRAAIASRRRQFSFRYKFENEPEIWRRTHNMSEEFLRQFPEIEMPVGSHIDTVLRL